MKNPFTSHKLGFAVLAAVGFALPASSQTLENALDQSGGLTFTTVTFDYETGDPVPGIEWFGQTVTTHDTVDAAEASGLPIGSFSRLDATVQGPATISFWWKAATSNFLERLGFVSDEHFFSITDNVDWQYREIEIGCGEQVISWFLDISDLSQGADGAASAWLDQVTFTPLPNVPAIQSGLDNNTVDFYSDDWIQSTFTGIPPAVGGSVAMSGPVAEGGTSSVLFDVEGPVEISFDWGMESDPNAFNTSFDFEVDGRIEDQIFGSQTLTPRSFEFGPGHHCMNFIYRRDFPYVPDPENPDPPYTGATEGFVDNMVITQIPSSGVLADAVDVAPDVYGKAWFRQSQITHDGVDAACVVPPDLDDSETMYVDLPDDAGLLSLWVKLSTEPGYGFLTAWVDGDFIGSFSGEQDWVEIEANLGTGNNRVLWLTYRRFSGGTGNFGDDVAYVDQITLQPGASNYQPDLSIKPPRGKYKGDNRYSTTGLGQVAKYKAKLRRPFGKFKFNCQNDCPTDPDSMNFYGTKSNKNFEIFYIVKFEGKLYNISAEFQTGQFSTETLEILQSTPYEVWISRVQGSRRRTQTARVRGISESDPQKMDAFKARLIVDKFRRRRR